MSGAFESDYHDGDSRNTSLRASEAKDKPMHSKAIEAAAMAVQKVDPNYNDLTWEETPDRRRAKFEATAQAAVQAYLAAMEAEAVMVPVVPTAIMAAQGQWAISDNLAVSVCLENNARACKVYAAMLAARPQPKD